MPELALRTSATLLWVGAFGIGITACAVAPYLLREHTLPTAVGIRLFGGGALKRASPELLAVLLGLFVATCGLAGFVQRVDQRSGLPISQW